VSQYFAGLFSTEIDDPNPALLEKVQPKVTELMNDQLMKPFSAEEVKEDLFSIEDMKAPGADGLHAIFFKKCWEILGGILIEEVLNAVNNKIIPDGFAII
jgi:hypothetical protein